MGSNGAAADVYRVLVTGANGYIFPCEFEYSILLQALTEDSGLGYGICQRLIDKFLQTHPPTRTLCIIITTRDTKKGEDTIHKLQAYLQRAERATSTARKLSSRRVEFQHEVLDLNSVLSVQRLAKKLAKTKPHLDCVILNAGIGGWTHMKWGQAIWLILTDWRHSVTYPPFKGSGVGQLAKPQTAAKSAGPGQEPPLGNVFCANVFGHYLLAHYLAPLLARSHHGNGRIVWLSSLEAYAFTFKADDLQGLTHDVPYESSKRLTDTLALTASLPDTSPYVRDYLSDDNGVTEPLSSTRRSQPKVYVCHPGICATGIFPLPYILALAMAGAFYIARWIGSIWHTCTVYKGACAPVWLALSDQAVLDASEQQNGRQKFGSSTDFWGNEKVEWTEVEGWGYGGIVEQTPSSRIGRWNSAKDMTPADKLEFEKLGAVCWQEMEKLRKEWEKRIEGVVNGV